MKQPNEFLIDARTSGDLIETIAGRARSYTPEWAFQPERPDVGSVIALIFAAQMEDNIKRLDQVIDKYHTEFVNLLNLSLLPAFPASGVVTMELIGDTVSGVDVPRGTKLLGSAQVDGESIIFETERDIHITDAKLLDILAVSGRYGKLIPLAGDWTPTELLSLSAAEEEEPIAEPAPEETRPFVLFDYDGQGVERNQLILYHTSVFDTDDGVSVSIRIQDSDTGGSLVGQLADPTRYRWSCWTEEGLKPVEAELRGDTLMLSRTGENLHVKLDGVEYAVLVVEALGVVAHDLVASRIEIASSCSPTEPVCVVHNDEALDAAKFMPFGPTASLYEECYIGHDRIFYQQGATVCMNFQLSYEKKLVTMTPEQEQEELKIIKRKPTAVQFQTAETAAQRVIFEYFNGIGWRKLDCEQDWSTVFDGTSAGEMEIRFRCPDDWVPVTCGGFETRAIRMRIRQADNCYLQPCIHTMPVVSNLTLRYHYDGAWKQPQRLRTVRGTVVSDLTQAMLAEKPMVLFAPLPYEKNAILFGFDRAFSGAPISILFEIEENVHFESAPLYFEYSTRAGFKRLKAIDHTRGMSCTGTVIFFPPSDFAPLTVEGHQRYWLRLVDEDGSAGDPDRYHATLRRVLLNTVEVRNIETLPEESFYIEAATPNMVFPIAAENILSAEVFVNEFGTLPRAAMQQMLEETPDDVRVSYNFIGDISEFFVRWTEVDSFDESGPTDRHYMIDRMNNTIRFGDGVSVMIPTAQTEAAFTVQVHCCRGAAGNLPAGAIDSSFGHLLYVGDIYNPLATSAGSNMESVESARMRGASLMSSRGRLVSTLDFTRETLAFSTEIDKVRCVAGVDINGRRDDRLISIAVMPRNYREGAHTFASMRERLAARLLEKCEATVTGETLRIFEPIYLEISLDVWAETTDADSAFEIQNRLLEHIEDYLDPLSGRGRSGWEIGTRPTEEQLGMMLRSAGADAVIGRFVVTTRYTDASGVHEGGLDALRENPFVIGVNGTHRVHISFAG